MDHSGFVKLAKPGEFVRFLFLNIVIVMRKNHNEKMARKTLQPSKSWHKFLLGPIFKRLGKRVSTFK